MGITAVVHAKIKTEEMSKGGYKMTYPVVEEPKDTHRNTQRRLPG